MNYGTNEESRVIQNQYYSLLRNVLSDQYRGASNSEVEAVIASALDGLPEKEVEEFFGLVTGLASAVLPKVVPHIGRLAGRIIRRRKKRTRPLGRIPCMIRQRVNPQVSAIQQLQKMLQNPGFLATLIGQKLNTVSGRRVGRTKVRKVTNTSRGRETRELEFNEYMSALSYLADKAANSSDSSEADFFYEDNESFDFLNENENAENLVQNILGEEFQEDNEFASNDEFEFLEEGFNYQNNGSYY